MARSSLSLCCTMKCLTKPIRLGAAVLTLAGWSVVFAAQGDRTGSQRLSDRIEPELAFNRFEIILSVRGTLREPRTLDVPVDTTLTQLTVLPDPSPGLKATLVRPDGTV